MFSCRAPARHAPNIVVSQSVSQSVSLHTGTTHRQIRQLGPHQRGDLFPSRFPRTVHHHAADPSTTTPNPGWRLPLLRRHAGSCCGCTAPPRRASRAARRSPPTSPPPPPSACPSLPPPTTHIAGYGDEVITAWFGIPGVPITATTVRDEKGVLKAVEHVHEMINKEVAAGTSPTGIFVCGLSQGGALAIASVLLYPKTLGGCVVFSGSVPLNKSFAEGVPPEARKTPVLWFHGMADGLVLFEAGHAGCAFLQELGMTCEFKAYPTLGHSLVDEELQYFRQWVLERLGIPQVTEAARPSSSPWSQLVGYITTTSVN